MKELLTREDIPGAQDYERLREETRRRVMRTKDRRRVPVGDHCTVSFENRDTLKYQVLEMLRVEQSFGRPEAVEDELHAYNPLLPGDGDLSATVMFEYDTPEERAERLRELAGIDRHLWLVIGSEKPVLATFDSAQINDGKISSVQFVRWHLDPVRRDLLEEEGTVVRIVIDHPRYEAQSVLSEQTRAEIMRDPD